MPTIKTDTDLAAPGAAEIDGVPRQALPVERDRRTAQQGMNNQWFELQGYRSLEGRYLSLQH